MSTTADRMMTEAQWQTRVVDYATRSGWLVFHATTAQVRGAWMTAQLGHVGFPDLVLARDQVVLFAELKREGGKPTTAQLRWLATLPADRAFLWRPSDWPDVARVLARPRKAPTP